jgi:hypothetical protein
LYDKKSQFISKFLFPVINLPLLLSFLLQIKLLDLIIEANLTRSLLRQSRLLRQKGHFHILFQQFLPVKIIEPHILFQVIVTPSQSFFRHSIQQLINKFPRIFVFQVLRVRFFTRSDQFIDLLRIIRIFPKRHPPCQELVQTNA